jgi:hypothetical protein
LALVDFERDPEKEPPPDELVPEPRYDTPAGATRGAIADAASRGVGAVTHVVGATGRAVANPRALPGYAADAARLAGSLRRQLLVTDQAHSDVMEARSVRRRFEIRQLSLSKMRAAAARMGGSINDAYVTGLAAALGRYHQRLGSDVTELRLAMPVSTRQPGDRETTNAFVPARVLVPIQPADDLGGLFNDIHERLSDVKGESALGAAGSVAALASGLPTSVLVAVTRSQSRTIDFAASNLRGSSVPLYLAGARILANYPFGPRTGNALNVTIISYGDDMHLGFNIDPAAIVDTEGFMHDVDDTFAELVS